MAWYWIVLIIIGYNLLSILFGVIIVIKENNSAAAPFGFVWPISLPCFLLIWIGEYFLDFYNYKRYK